MATGQQPKDSNVDIVIMSSLKLNINDNEKLQCFYIFDRKNQNRTFGQFREIKFKD